MTSHSTDYTDTLLGGGAYTGGPAYTGDPISIPTAPTAVPLI